MTLAGAEMAENATVVEGAVMVGHYYVIASCLLVVGLCSILFVAHQFASNAYMRTPFILCFCPLFVGNLLYTLAFLPTHIRNWILFANNSPVEDFQDQIWCGYSFVFSMYSLFWMIGGMVLLSYVPFKTVRNAESFKSTKNVADILSPKRFCVFVTFATVLCVAVLVVSFAQGNVGPYRHLYCVVISWKSIPGVTTMVSLFSCFLLMLVYYCAAYSKMIKYSKSQKPKVPKVANEVQRDTSREAASSIFNFGLCMLTSIVVTWAWLFFSIAFAVVGFVPPLSFDVFAGLATKLKPTLDLLIFLQVPQVKRARSQLGSSSRSMDAGGLPNEPSPRSDPHLDFDFDEEEISLGLRNSQVNDIVNVRDLYLSQGDDYVAVV